MAQKPRSHYVVTYRDPAGGKTLGLKVRKVEDSELGPTFVALSEFLFESTSPIIDPALEDLRKRYEHTRKLHLSLYHIVSIEEVGRRNPGLDLSAERSNVIVLPGHPEG